MAIEYIKKSTNEKQRLDDNEKVKEIVENTLKEILTLLIFPLTQV